MHLRSNTVTGLFLHYIVIFIYLFISELIYAGQTYDQPRAFLPKRPVKTVKCTKMAETQGYM